MTQKEENSAPAGYGDLNPKFRTGGHLIYSKRNILIDSWIRDTLKTGANDAHAFGQGL